MNIQKNKIIYIKMSYLFVELQVLITNGSEEYKESIIIRYDNNILFNIHYSNDFFDIFDIVSNYLDNDRGYKDFTIESITLVHEYGDDWDEDLDADIDMHDSDISSDMSSDISSEDYDSYDE